MSKELKNYSYLLGKSAKIDKSDKTTKYDNYIMYLAPYNLSGVNVCPFASKGCADSCLNTAGRGKFTMVQNARLNRTKHYIKDQKGFKDNLTKEIDKLVKKHKNLAIRLNGTSDLNFNSYIKKVHKKYPNITFYDYTKNPKQAVRALRNPNYHVTFSRSETNDKECLEMLKHGVNVAVVFDKLPKTWNGYKVIDGDKSDTRFLDGEEGIVIGLLAKGKAKKDTTGFVVKIK